MQVAKLMESVETVFIEHFSNGNHGLGMKMLRQKAKTDRHRVTFFTGRLIGYRHITTTGAFHCQNLSLMLETVAIFGDVSQITYRWTTK